MATQTIIDGGKQAITFNNDTEPLAIYVDGELQQNVSFVPQPAQGTGVVSYASEYKKNHIKYEIQGATSQAETPSPDTPIPIENANSEGMSVILHGENLFNQEDLLTDNNFTKAEYNGEECIMIVPTSAANKVFNCDVPAGVVSLTFDFVHPNTGGGFAIYYICDDGTTIYGGYNAESPVTEFRKYSFIKTSTKRIVGIRFNFFSIAEKRPYYIKNFMLNIGEPKPYEPYFREEIAIPASVDITNDGTTTTVQLPFSIYDKLTVDRVTNEVIYHQGAGYKELRGIETFSRQTLTGEIPRFKILPSTLGFEQLNGDGYCSHFIVGETVYFGNDPTDFGNPKSISFVYDANSVEAFKSWLAAQYAAGTPVTILAEYTEVNPIDITNTTLGQSLLNLATQNQTNYIEVLGNANAPETPIKLTYAKWGELVENNGNT